MPRFFNKNTLYTVERLKQCIFRNYNNAAVTPPEEKQNRDLLYSVQSIIGRTALSEQTDRAYRSREYQPQRSLYGGGTDGSRREVSFMNMKLNDRVRTFVFPLLAALVWGLAFVVQKFNHMGTFYFNASRSLVACVFLLPLIMGMRKCGVKKALTENTRRATGRLWLGGALCGAAMSLATYFQQHGLDAGTDAGKAGFITALYMVLVPLFGLLLGKKCGWNIYLAALLAVLALYLLCIQKDLTVVQSDLWVFFAPFLFCAQILLIDHYAPEVDCVKLSFVQFVSAFVVSALGGLILGEDISLQGIEESLPAILYLGIFSSGVGYTLQMVAQKGSNPTVVSILMSMESVFSLIFGAVLLGDSMTDKQLLGCALMLAAVVLTQLMPGGKKKNRD